MRRMNSFGRQGLVAAMENEEVNTPEVAEVEGGAENLETDLLEVQEEAAEADAVEAQIEETVETAEALEGIAISLEACAANGGLTKDAAHVVGLALDHMYKSVGISSRAMPALESFGQTSSRVGATQLALEDLKEKIKQIWAAIKKAIIDAYNWVRERFLKVFGAAEKLQKRAKALAERATDTPDVKAAETTIESERLVHALHIDGDTKKVQAGLEVLKKLVAEELTTDTKAIEAAKDALENPEAVQGATLFAALTSFPKSAGQEAVAKPEDAGFGAQPANVTMTRSKELLGGKAIIVRTSTAKETTPAAVLEAAAKIRVSVGDYNPKAAKITKTKLDTLTSSAAGEIASIVADMAKDLAAYKLALNKIESAKKGLISAIDKAGNELSKDESEEKKALGTAAGKFASALPAILDSLPTGLSTLALTAGKSACDYVELSLKQYKAA